MKLRQTNSVTAVAAKAGFSTATGYRLLQAPVLPSMCERDLGRRRPDPLAEIFDSEIVPLLKAAPGLRPIWALEEMMRATLTSPPRSAAPGCAGPWGRAGGDFPPNP